MKKLMIAAVSSGSGKTTITLGLMKLLQNRGYRVQPYKVGPDYVDTEYHTRITGNPSR
ncbi:AAA family ATPase, partial [Enterococcus sp. S181_ASV_20]|nr:AAA family ATPase [Enterococcus sp. S181_ASV_20]